MGASAPLRVSVTAAVEDDPHPPLLATATLRAVGGGIGPAAEISLPLLDPDPVHFDWVVRAREAGPVWLTLSLRLRSLGADGSLLGERLVWAHSTALHAQSWLGLSAPAARGCGLASALAAAAVLWRMAREGRR